MPALCRASRSGITPAPPQRDGRDKPGHDEPDPMHDIRFIRDNLQAFDDGLAKRGLAPMAAQPSRSTRSAGAPSRQRRGAAPQRAVEGDRPGKGEEGRRARERADGRGRAAQGERAAARGGGARGERGATRPSPEIPNRRTPRCPSARTSTVMSRGAASATPATSPSRRSISSSARRCASWISKPPRSSPARASWC